ncbi:cytosolic leucyl tRNA synthetase [Sorochytrium milnesiophthora]
MSAAIDAAKSTAKRDALIALEQKYQQQWEESKFFETDAPEDLLEPRYFANTPYPYLNGRLHLGHSFTVSKVEFAMGYQRLKGKRCLFPFAFHVTGMPIKACADKLKREVELFGKNFENFDSVVVELERQEAELAEQQAQQQQAKSDDPTKFVKKAGKVAAKKAVQKYQWQIMEATGVPRDEIHRFADIMHWLDYFPPFATADLKAFGAKVDWRRTFITTDVNPFYDAFIRWQFNKLKALDKVKFGERVTIWSVKDGQPCMDHDRQTGEGVGPQEYVGIKLQVVTDKVESPEIKRLLGMDGVRGKNVYLVAATLRPETMYGQTNCFVGTDIEYGLWEINDTDVFICTERAARNMSFQGFAKEKGVHVRLGSVHGTDLIGLAVKAPLSKYDHVFVLPLEHVLANKGTGVVTSVPSDSPDDYAMTRDLKKKPEFYKIKSEWIASYDPVEIISTPTYGRMAAEKACQELKISSPKDRVQLDKAKEVVYKEGFYNGTMLVGDHAGKSVQEAKPLIKELLVARGEAIVYSEPEKEIISRSGDECVVNLCDQWYLDYGEEQWKEQTAKLLAKMELYSGEARSAFENALDWLKQWACARSFGLGTRLPWDHSFVIESLSDSTIYMAYYTIAHLLEGGHMDKNKLGPLQIRPEQLTDDVFEYIFNDSVTAVPKSTDIEKHKLDKLRREFQYFCGFDLRSSGRDLIGNHLTFCLYNHACLFPEERWPRSMRVNGHLLRNSEKMSKSTGNFLNLGDALRLYGTDATRLGLADAGDSLEDANFVEATVNAAILRLYTQKEWCEDIVKPVGPPTTMTDTVTPAAAPLASALRTGPKDVSFADRVFVNEVTRLVNETEQHYEQMMYRDALRTGFYELQDARDWYRETTALTGEGMHHELVLWFIEVQALMLAPFTPHWSEYVWQEVLHKPTSIMQARWPVMPKAVDEGILAAANYVKGVIHSARTAEASAAKKKQKKGAAETAAPDAGGSKPKRVAKLIRADRFPEWQEQVIEVLKQVHAQAGGSADWKGAELAALRQAGLLANKKVMPFVSDMKKLVAQHGARAFERALAFDERQVLEMCHALISLHLQLDSLDILASHETDRMDADDRKKIELTTPVPGAPVFRMVV